MTSSRKPERDADWAQTLCCSFCGKGKHAVAKIIAGPGVYICDECVDLCDQILATEREPARSEPVPELNSPHQQSDDELLASLARIQAAAAQADAALHDHVGSLRDRASAGPGSERRSAYRSRLPGSGSPVRINRC